MPRLKIGKALLEAGCAVRHGGQSAPEGIAPSASILQAQSRRRVLAKDDEAKPKLDGWQLHRDRVRKQGLK